MIAAVNGAAAGGGNELVVACDLAVAAESATFGLTEARYGLFPLGGSTVRLQRQIPRTAAMDMLLTGRRIDARQALEWGLIGRVVPDGEALSAAREIAEQIAANGPVAVQAIKASVLAAADLSEADGLAQELALGQPVFATRDAREGPRAFAERRTPRFEGR